MAADHLFRVFVSSTFADFVEERRILETRVFPALVRHCERFATRFLPIDLRWGVANEAALEQDSVSICLAEVDHCMENSPRPAMLMLIGERYGWCPLPQSIAEAEFAALERHLGDAARTGRWYRLDENAVPPCRWLAPRDPNGRFAAPEVWAVEEAALLDDLRQAAAAAQLDELAERLATSVTEMEIARFLDRSHGALGIGFLRTFADDGQEIPAFLRDAQVLPDRLQALRQRVEASGVVRVEHLAANVAGDRPDDAYLERFAIAAEAVLIKAVDSELARVTAVSELAAEQAAHAAAARALSAQFRGRADEIARIHEYIASASHGFPLFVTGRGGMGKSALIAAALAKPVTDALVVQRFIGATPDSSDPSLLVASLVAELEDRVAFSKDDLANMPPEPRGRLPAMLARLPAQARVVLVLDGLDQLSRGGIPAWLPAACPPNLRVLLSAAEASSASDFAHNLPPANILRLRALDAPALRAIVADTLARARRTLSPEQEALLLDGCLADGTALYARIASQEASRWRSLDEPAALPPDCGGLIAQFLTRLTNGKTHGNVLGNRVLGLVSASIAGLSESELFEIVRDDAEIRSEFLQRHPNSPPTDHLPIIVLVRLLADMREYLVQRASDGEILVGFAHRLFGEAIREWLFDDDSWQDLHRRLAGYFEGKPTWGDPERARAGEAVANARRASEFWPHVLATGDAARIAEALCRFDTVMAHCALNRAASLLPVYDEAVELAPDSALGQWRDFLADNELLLLAGKAGWPAHKILLQLAAEAPLGHPLRHAADDWLAADRCEWEWWRRIGEVSEAQEKDETGITRAGAHAERLADGAIAVSLKARQQGEPAYMIVRDGERVQYLLAPRELPVSRLIEAADGSLVHVGQDLLIWRPGGRLAVDHSLGDLVAYDDQGPKFPRSPPPPQVQPFGDKLVLGWSHDRLFVIDTNGTVTAGTGSRPRAFLQDHNWSCYMVETGDRLAVWGRGDGITLRDQDLALLDHIPEALCLAYPRGMNHREGRCAWSADRISFASSNGTIGIIENGMRQADLARLPVDLQKPVMITAASGDLLLADRNNCFIIKPDGAVIMLKEAGAFPGTEGYLTLLATGQGCWVIEGSASQKLSQVYDEKGRFVGSVGSEYATTLADGSILFQNPQRPTSGMERAELPFIRIDPATRQAGTWPLATSFPDYPGFSLASSQVQALGEDKVLVGEGGIGVTLCFDTRGNLLGHVDADLHALHFCTDLGDGLYFCGGYRKGQVLIDSNRLATETPRTTPKIPDFQFVHAVDQSGWLATAGEHRFGIGFFDADGRLCSVADWVPGPDKLTGQYFVMLPAAWGEARVAAHFGHDVALFAADGRELQWLGPVPMQIHRLHALNGLLVANGLEGGVYVWNSDDREMLEITADGGGTFAGGACQALSDGTFLSSTATNMIIFTDRGEILRRVRIPSSWGAPNELRPDLFAFAHNGIVVTVAGLDGQVVETLRSNDRALAEELDHYCSEPMRENRRRKRAGRLQASLDAQVQPALDISVGGAGIETVDRETGEQHLWACKGRLSSAAPLGRNRVGIVVDSKMMALARMGGKTQLATAPVADPPSAPTSATSSVQATKQSAKEQSILDRIRQRLFPSR